MKIIEERKLVGSQASKQAWTLWASDWPQLLLYLYYIHKKNFWKTQKLVYIMQDILWSANFVQSTENYEYST